jgi:hypothetical protein
MKVLVVHDGTCRPELKQIEDWLKATSCEVVFFDLTLEEHEKSFVDLVAECDVVLFLFTPNFPMADANIGVLSAKSKGKKIVGVQLADVSPNTDFGKYASALIAYNEAALISNVCGDQSDWTNKHGDKRPAPKTRRHNC